MPDYAIMNQFLYEGKAPKVEELTKAALAEGRDVEEVLQEGLIAAMSVVGEDFKRNRIYVPQVLIAARAMKAGMAYIEPILSASGIEPVGTVVMGTVKGDLHDIGKNLCIMMLRGAGFVVHDLSVDTSEDEFIDAVEEYDADLLGMSALLTTTMPNMGKTIEGAPVTQEFADDMGADGYGKDAVECVELSKRLLAEDDEEF